MLDSPPPPTGARTVWAMLTIAVVALGIGCDPSVVEPAAGPWRAVLDSPGGPLPFGLELTRGASGLEATFVNGAERLAVETVELDRGSRRLRLTMDRYDSTIDAELSADGTRLDGNWTKTAGAGSRSELSFSAVAGAAPRFERAKGRPAPTAAQIARIDGRWSVRFDGDEQLAVGQFSAKSDGRIEGTFLTTTGDYRFLEGEFDGTNLRLSCFDGAHAFLFSAVLDDAGELSGDFWSRDSWHQSWTARRDASASLPDAFELTGYRGERSLGEMVFVDLDGRSIALNDPAFAGRARIVEVFGSWCPNCNDSIPHLVELDRRYRREGLSIVGVAFELTGDRERDARQVRLFADHHDVEFPLVLGGISDKSAASEAFGLLDRIRSYPTTIFLHGDGRVKAVHQGYVGPAAPEANAALRRRFDELVRELLSLEPLR